MDNNEMEIDVQDELAKRLKESEKSYKVFGFTHIIVIGYIADLMDSSFRTNIDAMFRRTKSHCKTDEEVDLYRQNLCKLYLTYLQRGLVNIDSLEPKLATILTVKEESPIETVQKRLIKLRTKVADRMKRFQSLLALQVRLKNNTILAKWTMSKVEPIVKEAENDLANIQIEPHDDIVSILNNLNSLKSSLQSLELK